MERLTELTHVPGTGMKVLQNSEVPGRSPNVVPVPVPAPGYFSQWHTRTPGIVPRAHRTSRTPGTDMNVVQKLQKFRVRVIPRVWLCTYPTEHNLILFTDISSGYGYGRFTELTEVQGTGMEVLHTKVTQ